MAWHDEAIALLSTPATPAITATSLHKVRVITKKLRALTRLYRRKDNRTQAREIRHQLQRIAHVFSTCRDADALQQTLLSFRKNADKVTARHLLLLANTLQQENQHALAVLTATSSLQDFKSVKDLWTHSLQNAEDRDIIKAFEKSLRNTLRCGSKTLKAHDHTGLHKWRKRVKHLFYQLEIFTANNAQLQRHSKRFKRLGSLLGDVHDLDLLEAYLKTANKNNTDILYLVHKRRVRLIKKIRAVHAQTQVPA